MHKPGCPEGITSTLFKCLQAVTMDKDIPINISQHGKRCRSLDENVWAPIWFAGTLPDSSLSFSELAFRLLSYNLHFSKGCNCDAQNGSFCPRQWSCTKVIKLRGNILQYVESAHHAITETDKLVQISPNVPQFNLTKRITSLLKMATKFCIAKQQN